MWTIYKFDPDQRKNVKVGEIDGLPFDCDGDDLYDMMTEMGIIENINNFQVEGDTDGVVLMSRREQDVDRDDFFLHFTGEKPYRYFMTIWSCNSPFMDAAASEMNAKIRYTPHPDNDFLCVECNDPYITGDLTYRYKKYKDRAKNA